jgi:O-succinylbenzoate synthase
MKIESIALSEIQMQLQTPFETSFGITQARRILLVEVRADGASGWGEVATEETPAYNAETADTARYVISDFIARSLVGRSVTAASEYRD